MPVRIRTENNSFQFQIALVLDDKGFLFFWQSICSAKMELMP
jgi:hypothetical protein